MTENEVYDEEQSLQRRMRFMMKGGVYGEE